MFLVPKYHEGIEELRGNPGGPSPKTKYMSSTDSVQVP